MGLLTSRQSDIPLLPVLTNSVLLPDFKSSESPKQIWPQKTTCCSRDKGETLSLNRSSMSRRHSCVRLREERKKEKGKAVLLLHGCVCTYVVPPPSTLALDAEHYQKVRTRLDGSTIFRSAQPAYVLARTLIQKCFAEPTPKKKKKRTTD